MKKRKYPRLRSVDEMRKEDLRRAIDYYERHINNPKVSPDTRLRFARQNNLRQKELAMLESIPDSAYQRT